jgi:hypothetical protein
MARFCKNGNNNSELDFVEYALWHARRRNGHSLPENILFEVV